MKISPIPVRLALRRRLVVAPALLLFLTSIATVPAIAMQRARSGEQPSRQPNNGPDSRPRVDLASVPLSFEANAGQTDPRVRYLARGQGYTVFLTDDEAVLSLATAPPDRRPAADRGRTRASAAGESLRLSFEGARSGARLVPDRELAGEVNYLVGSDTTKWRTKVSTFAAVRYERMYEGIDAVFYGTRQQLEYDFVVEPNADPSQIRVRFDGARRVEVDESGDLVLELASGEIRQQRAAVFQETPDGRRAISARYSVDAGGQVRFDVAEYDRTRPLVIDPVLVYGAWLGGATSPDYCEAVALDTAGNIYVTGSTQSTDFPVTVAAYDATFNGGQTDVFVSKVSADGTAIVYSTLVGGSGFQDGGTAIAVDANGAAYVTGSTRSVDFPTTPGAYDRTHGTEQFEDTFVFKLTPDGSALDFSSYVGGEWCRGWGVAIRGGTVYVVGTTQTPNHVTTPAAYDRTFNGSGLDQDGFVAALSADGSSLIYSTFLGGPGLCQPVASAVDATGAVFVAGYTATASFGTTPGALDTQFGGNTDAFVLKLAPGGNALAYSTFLGGTLGTVAFGIAIDAAGAAYVTGSTTATNFPTTDGAYDRSYNGGLFVGDAYAAKLSPNGSSLLYSTYLGASGEDEGLGIAVDSSGSAYVVGSTRSGGFPITAGAFDVTLGDPRNGTGYVTKLAPNGGSLVYSSYLGGGHYDYAADVAVDASGAATVVGHTESLDFPSVGTPLAVRDSSAGFISKVAPAGTALVFSTTFGGVTTPNVGVGDEATAIAVASDGATVIAGSTMAVNFPTTPGTFDPVFDENPPGDFPEPHVFVTKLNAAGTSIVYSTFLGGRDDDRPYDMVLDGGGAVYLGGVTSSTDFPVTSGAFDTTVDQLEDGFVAKLSADGSSLVFSTIIGAEGFDSVRGLKRAFDGTLYLTGSTSSIAFPTTAGAYDTTHNGADDAFVARLSADGSSLLLSTYFGGLNVDAAESIALDAALGVYVCGRTESETFPVTPGAADPVYGGGFVDGFVARFAPNLGSVAYSAFLGGDRRDTANGIDVDASGNAVVAGTTASANFPVTPGAFDPVHEDIGTDHNDIFVTRLSPGGAIQSSTYVGGTSEDEGAAVVLDANGVAHVCGSTASADFPTTVGAVPSGGLGDAVVVSLSPDGSSLRYATTLGGDNGDSALAIALDGAGAVYVAGATNSADFPTAGFGYRDGFQAFVAKLAPEPGAGRDTAGVYVPASGAWFLRNRNSAGAADLTVVYGPPGLKPVSGDWNGDGVDSLGVFNPSTSTFFLKNSASGGSADIVVSFGPPGANWIPLAGDWNADGADTVGLYDPTSGTFFLKNTNTPGVADLVFTFGPAGATPIVGDWNGDGTDTVGIYVSASGAFFLKNTNSPGNADIVFTYGAGGATPVVGDWNGDGVQTVGLYVPATGVFFLRNANSSGAADVVFSYGPPGATPVTGNWDGL